MEISQKPQGHFAIPEGYILVPLGMHNQLGLAAPTKVEKISDSRAIVSVSRFFLGHETTVNLELDHFTPKKEITNVRTPSES